MPDIDTTKLPTLANLLHGTQPQAEREIIEGVLYEAPLLSRLPAKIIRGTDYRQRVRTALPMIMATAYNAGVRPFRSSYEVQNAQCYPYQTLAVVDKKLVHAHPEEFGAWMEEEIRGAIRGIMATLEYHAIYGKGVSNTGMPGLVDVIGDHMTISADSDHATDATREQSGTSVWALNLKQGVGPTTVWGKSKAIRFGAQRETDLTMPTVNGESGIMPAYVRDLDFHVGLSQMSEYASARLVNVSDNKPLTDTLLEQLVSLMPSAVQPDVLVMNRKALRQLRASRAQSLTYVKKSGSNQMTYADLPRDFDGIPIIVTDMILNDETEANIAALRAQTELKPIKDTNNLTR